MGVDNKTIRACLDSIEFGVVATVEAGKARTRAMHFAYDENFVFYLSSLKGDAKIAQMVSQPAVDLLLIKNEPGFPDVEEVEILGSAKIISSEKEREAAFELLAKKSPIVANLKASGATGMLAAIRVTPTVIKYRKVAEIMRGVGPTVLEFADVKNKFAVISAWITELRAPFLSASVIPVVLGALIAWSRLNVFDLNGFLLTLFGIVFLHLGTNIANDYFDHKSGTDDINTEFVRPFSGGSRMIQKKLLPAWQVLAVALLFFGLGSVIGLYLTLTKGLMILALGLFGIFCGYFYSAPPFRLAGSGLGELVVGLNFGSLVTLGAYFVQTGALSWEPVVASLPVALLIAAVLYINEFPDYTADKTVGKNNLVVRMGKEMAAKGYVAMIWAVYISIVLGCALRLISPFALLGLLTLPRALRAIRVAKANFNDTLFLIPANADTVMLHLYTGILLSLGYALQWIFKG